MFAKPKVESWEKTIARRAETTLWMQIKQGGKNRYVSVPKLKNGRYAPNAEDPYEPGPYLAIGLVFKKDRLVAEIADQIERYPERYDILEKEQS
jgi:hypothetical protein